jgi:hypothetical protein
MFTMQKIFLEHIMTTFSSFFVLVIRLEQLVLDHWMWTKVIKINNRKGV